MSDDWKRLRQVAAIAARALLPAATRAVFDRAFRRDVTVTGYRVHDVVEALGVPYRSSLRDAYIPGRLVISTDDDDELAPEAIEDFAERGGTLICEAKHGLALARAAGLEVREVAVPRGRREIAGPAVDRLPWKPPVPIAFIDENAVAAKLAGGEVLVRDREGMALVTRVPLGRGAFVHVAWQTVPFERKPPAPTTTHHALAALLGIAPIGILSTDTPINVEQAFIQLLAYGVLAELAATALSS